ncbi:hypothetical protein RI054_13g65940 [Pseudoscourfieldia marina]
MASTSGYCPPCVEQQQHAPVAAAAAAAAVPTAAAAVPTRYPPREYRSAVLASALTLQSMLQSRRRSLAAAEGNLGVQQQQQQDKSVLPLTPPQINKEDHVNPTPETPDSSDINGACKNNNKRGGDGDSRYDAATTKEEEDQIAQQKQKKQKVDLGTASVKASAFTTVHRPHPKHIRETTQQQFIRVFVPHINQHVLLPIVGGNDNPTTLLATPVPNLQLPIVSTNGAGFPQIESQYNPFGIQQQLQQYAHAASFGANVAAAAAAATPLPFNASLHPAATFPSFPPPTSHFPIGSITSQPVTPFGIGASHPAPLPANASLFANGVANTRSAAAGGGGASHPAPLPANANLFANGVANTRSAAGGGGASHQPPLPVNANLFANGAANTSGGYDYMVRSGGKPPSAVPEQRENDGVKRRLARCPTCRVRKVGACGGPAATKRCYRKRGIWETREVAMATPGRKVMRNNTIRDEDSAHMATFIDHVRTFQKNTQSASCSKRNN